MIYWQWHKTSPPVLCFLCKWPEIVLMHSEQLPILKIHFNNWHSRKTQTCFNADCVAPMGGPAVVHTGSLPCFTETFKRTQIRLVFVRWKRPGAAAWAVFMAVLRAADMKQIFQQSCVRLPFPFSHMLFYWFQFQIMRSIYVKIINAFKPEARGSDWNEFSTLWSARCYKRYSRVIY